MNSGGLVPKKKEKTPRAANGTGAKALELTVWQQAPERGVMCCFSGGFYSIRPGCCGLDLPVR